MRRIAAFLAFAGGSALMLTMMAVVPSVSQAATSSCTATISPPSGPYYSDQELTVSASGFDPNEADVVTITHNGSVTGSDGEANSAGVDSYTFEFPAGTWEYAWQGRSSGLTCSVSWTVLDASASTTTTAAPTTTTTPGSSSTTTASTSTSSAVAPAAVNAQPAFTG